MPTPGFVADRVPWTAVTTSDPAVVALAKRGRREIVANDHVRLRPLTWREQIGFVVALPLLFLLWAVMPWGPLTSWPVLTMVLMVAALPTAIVFRGRRSLSRARKMLGEGRGRAAALPRLEKLAGSSLSGVAVRADAGAHAALLRLEAGELEAALRISSLPLRDGTSSVRARTPKVGYFGEAVRSVLAWLFPELGLRPIAASVLRPPADTSVAIGYEGLDLMVATLRVLEASGRDAGPSVRRAFAELDVSRLGDEYPVLCALVLGTVRRHEPAAEAELAQRLDALRGSSREVVTRRFPDLADRDGEPYRLPAPVTSTALERAAPTALQALRATPGLTKWIPLPARGGPWSALFSLWLLLTALGGNDPLLYVLAAVFGGMWVSTLAHQRDRVRPLREAGVTSPARLRELSLMAARAGPRTTGAPTPHPFDRGELMLVVGLAQAEVCLRDGEIEDAKEQIGWWLEGLDVGVLATVDLYAVAASALRVATLLGYRDAAMHLNGWIVSSPSRIGRTRTGHGNAPRAVWLARALHLAHDGLDAVALRALDQAAPQREVVLDDFERELYGVLIERMARRGHVIPERLRALRWQSAEPSWIGQVWPDPRALPSRD